MLMRMIFYVCVLKILEKFPSTQTKNKTKKTQLYPSLVALGLMEYHIDEEERKPNAKLNYKRIITFRFKQVRKIIKWELAKVKSDPSHLFPVPVLSSGLCGPFPMVIEIVIDIVQENFR